MDAYNKYLELHKLLIESMKSGDEQTGDNIRDEMDTVWYKMMTYEDRQKIEHDIFWDKI